MKKFDMIIGYTATKNELQQIADILKNRDAYDTLGVSSPSGLLIYGEPGVGKSLMANAIIEASERPTFVCHKDKPNDDFIKEIKATFHKAIANAPSIVYLDDMDKFSNGDEHHPDAEEYVTVQSCIDEAKGKEVFILATANSLQCFPHSLCRSGRFDRVLRVKTPQGQDAIKIITHYLSTKKIVENVDAKIIARIMDGHSCAELETVINEAGLYAGYERAESITMKHLMTACLRTVFDIPAALDNYDVNDDFANLLSDPNNIISQIVYHEAGHVIVSEILCPESVNFVFAYNNDETSGGITDCYNDRTHTPLYWTKSRIVGSLGGIAGIEQKYGIFHTGGERDIDEAFDRTRDLVENNCICGLHLHYNGFEDSENLKSAQEQAVSAEIEKFYRKAKEIISLNHEFFEKIAVALAQKRLLSAVDIQKIKHDCKIVPVVL